VAIVAGAPIYFGDERSVDLGACLTLVGFGVALGLLILVARARTQVVQHFVGRMVAMIGYLLVFAWVLPQPSVQRFDNGWGVMMPLALAATAWLLILIGAMTIERRLPYAVEAVSDEFIGDINVFVSLVATGALFALAERQIGLWALGVAGLPFLFARSAFGRFTTTQNTYRQTIRALARIPEVAGLGFEGHADRTAALAQEVGYELGLGRRDLEDLECAALMHDIGRITLTEPAILRLGYTDDDIARWGAEIISEAPSLKPIAEHVRKLHEPYRKPGEQSDPSISVISKIVRAASSYDNLVVGRQLSALQAIEVLHQGAAYDFDPAVITVLREVLERRMAFHPATT
ncbi:MAG: HD-GYP domain-containing protein, partial [Acidimicrobiia bacterium]